MKISEFFASTTTITLLLLVVASTAMAQAGSRPPEAEVEEYLKKYVVIGFEWVDIPTNRIALFRSSNTVCAIRFLSYSRENDSRPATSFDTGDASQFASYEVVELTSKGTELAQATVNRKELDDRGMRGIGRLAFGIGSTDIQCGRDKYSWMYPTGVLLKSRRQSMLVAPTNWTNFSEVRMDDPRLIWYRRDEKRERPLLFIPLDKLPSAGKVD